MVTEEVLVLTRLAQKYPAYSQALLELMEIVLTNGRFEPSGGTEGPTIVESSISFPVEVFHVWNSQRYTGKLYGDRTLEVDGKRYESPSAAGSAITGYAVNGWLWWQYRDPASRQIRPTDYLRKRGLISNAG